METTIKRGPLSELLFYFLLQPAWVMVKAWQLNRERGNRTEKTKSIETPCIDDGGSVVTGCRHNQVV
jgi:hypothetical protein